MARVQTIVCDRCSAKDSDVPVIPWTGRRASVRVQGDLCDNCWKDLLSMFRPATAPKGRHQIVVVDPDKIGK